MVFDVITIFPEMFDAVADWARTHGVHDVRTQAAWNQHAMLRWLDDVGFALAPACVITRTVGDREPEELDEDDAPTPEQVLDKLERLFK